MSCSKGDHKEPAWSYAGWVIYCRSCRKTLHNFGRHVPAEERREWDKLYEVKDSLRGLRPVVKRGRVHWEVNPEKPKPPPPRMVREGATAVERRFAEADTMGRVMAHSFMEEVGRG